MGWVPDQLTPDPLGFDVHRVGGFFFPFVTALVMVLSHNLQVVNFDLQRSSANMHGFLISHNREYCDSLEFADSKDLLEPNKKYPHDAEIDIRLYFPLSCGFDFGPFQALPNSFLEFRWRPRAGRRGRRRSD